MDGDRIRALASEIAAADGAVAVTGAGLSTASGIPDFRSDGGIWETHDPRDFHYDRFLADPGGFWQDRLGLQRDLFPDDVEPNAAHEALADLESAGHLDAVVTQNVDGLHESAGSERVIRLHGTADEVECVDCGARQPSDRVSERVREGEVPPRCGDCEGVLKPATVLFGESLPTGALNSAQRRMREADVVVVAGTSLTVEPAASLPRQADRAGATVAVVNLDSTSISDSADYDSRADVTDVLPELATAVTAETA